MTQEARPVMSVQSIIDKMEALETQLESLRDGVDQFGPVYELVESALRNQRVARHSLQRTEVYEDVGPSDYEDAYRQDSRERAKEYT